jgi:hypothetical protein
MPVEPATSIATPLLAAAALPQPPAEPLPPPFRGDPLAALRAMSEYELIALFS